MSPKHQSASRYIPVLISACVLLALSFGIRSGFGLFMQPMSEANGWGRDVLALALAIQNLSWGLSAVVAGGLVNRFGTARVLLGGILLYGLGILGMASSTTALSANLTAGVIIGAGVAGTSFGIVLPAIASAVPAEKQGWALGIGTAAGSVGQFLVARRLTAHGYSRVRHGSLRYSPRKIRPADEHGRHSISAPKPMATHEASIENTLLRAATYWLLRVWVSPRLYYRAHAGLCRRSGI
jgi:sugar phosphate permease